MAIPDDILRKPGKYTDDEQALMREHCARGYNMLRKIPFFSPAPLKSSSCHQEHHDGNGYPNRLAWPTEIPIGAPHLLQWPIPLDAITSDRPNIAKPPAASTSRAKKSSAARRTQFDPAVVKVFLKIPN